MPRHISLDQASNEIASIIVNLPLSEQTSVVLALSLILSRISEINKDTEDTIARITQTSSGWHNKSNCAR